MSDEFTKIVKRRSRKEFEPLFKHMCDCKQCRPFIGMPLTETKLKLCWQAQKYINEERLLE